MTVELHSLDFCAFCGAVFAGTLYRAEHEANDCPKRGVVQFNDPPRHRRAPPATPDPLLEI